jgi:hypothetical protein
MTEDQLLEALARLLTRREDLTNAAFRRALLELALRIRALLSTLPTEGQLLRTLRYNQLRPQILAALQTLTNTYYTELRLNLPTLHATLTELLYRFYALTTLPPAPTLDTLLTTTNVLNRSTRTLFAPAPTGLSPFTLQLERLLDTSVRAAILRDAPLPELLDTITPRSARALRKSTVANAWFDRLGATTAAIYWSLVTPISTEAASTTDQPPTAWRWNAILDPKTCPICRPLHNTVAPNPNAFPNGAPPVHPRCRCITIPL